MAEHISDSACFRSLNLLDERKLFASLAPENGRAPAAGRAMGHGGRLAAAALLLLFFFCCAGCGHAGQPGNEARPPVHHTEDGFRNPGGEPQRHGFFRFLKMRYFSGEEFADYEGSAHKVPRVAPDLEQIHHPGPAPQITWIGHATVLIQHRGVAVLTDPMFSDRASPVGFAGPKRYHPPALRIADLPDVDYVVISHNHYDHLDLRSVRELGSAPLWLVPLGLRPWFLDAGIEDDRIMELDWWDSRPLGEVTVTATPARHWSARSLWDRNETLWASWMVRIGDFSFWYSGDTGYDPLLFKEIGARFPAVDLALISIGAYEPRWFMKEMHVNPEEAVRIHEEIGARRSLAVQWGTFQLSAEPIDDPPEKLREALMNSGIPPDAFTAVPIGGTILLGGVDH